jgi:hypothetical protein
MLEGREGLYHGVFSLAEGKKGIIQGDAAGLISEAPTPAGSSSRDDVDAYTLAVVDAA